MSRKFESSGNLTKIKLLSLFQRDSMIIALNAKAPLRRSEYQASFLRTEVIPKRMTGLNLYSIDMTQCQGNCSDV